MEKGYKNVSLNKTLLKKYEFFELGKIWQFKIRNRGGRTTSRLGSARDGDEQCS